MKKFAFLAGALAISVAALVAGQASAAVVQANVVVTGISQTNAPINQAGLAAAAAVGNTGSGEDIEATAVNAGNMATATVNETATLNNSGFLGGNLVQTSLVQTNATVTQMNAAIAGSGDLGYDSTIKSVAANLGNNGTISVSSNATLN